MKKIHFTIFIILFTGILQVNGQTKGDIGQLYVSFEQNILSIDKSVPLSRATKRIPFIVFGAEMHFKHEVAGYVEVGVGLSSSPKGLADNINQFGELNQSRQLNVLDHYRYGWGENSWKGVVGLSYRLYSKGWRFAPQVGLGVWEFSFEDLYYELKERGTSNMYQANYQIRTGSSSGSDALYYMPFRFRTDKKISQRFSLHISAGYNLYLNRFHYSAQFSDYYTGNILENVSVKKRPHELTFSLGIGFR